ncbi:hypothetical protein [Streptomyces sp. NBC_01216]|uniref:hypothetical protein n=1 Tax=unclassified Streptomyces TaxID=2593676 RepID=UPI002E0F42B5|nr:hypothetical protein OG393_08420 [Streptomyces sp. NBC_01216]
MSLASTAPEPGTAGGGGDKLKHSGGPWTSASATAADLRTSTETSRSALGPGHEGIGTAAAGFASAGSLRAVLTSWEERLSAVRDECEQLTGSLRTVAKEMGETEVAIRKSFAGADRSADGSSGSAGGRR